MAHILSMSNFTGDSVVKVTQESFQKIVNGVEFPLILSPVDSGISFEALQKWGDENKNLVDKLTKLHGAVLFSGFSCIVSAKEFNDLVESFGIEALPYVGGAAPRTNVYKGVFTSNESPPSEKIPFHHEMAQVPTYPSKIFFYSDVPAKSGGETPILRSDQLFEEVKKQLPEFTSQLEAKGVKYTRVLPSEDDPLSPIGRGWKSTFMTLDPEVAKEKAKTLGVTLKWRPDGNVESVSGVLPAIKPYVHDTSRKVFFNSMIAAYTGWKDSRNTPEKAVTFGDGEMLDPPKIDKVRQIMEDICVAFIWKKGDVICIDNNLVMHARRTFEPPRKVLAYVAK